MWEDHLDYPMLCLSLRLSPGLRIDLKCAPAICVPHESLNDLHVLSDGHQHSGKAVPIDMLLHPGTRRPDGSSGRSLP